MTYLAGTCKAIFSGTLAGGEVFAHGFQIHTMNTWTQTDIANLCARVRDLFVTNFLTTGTRSLFPTTVSWNQLTMYYYLGAKEAALTALATISAGAGTGAGAPLPNQCSLVATLLSGIPGRSHRGRSYLPAPHVSGMSNGQLTVATAQAIATPLAAFLTAVKNDTTWAMWPAISSPTTQTDSQVKSVRVDTKLDTQRRRANKQIIVGNSTVSV